MSDLTVLALTTGARAPRTLISGPVSVLVLVLGCVGVSRPTPTSHHTEAETRFLRRAGALTTAEGRCGSAAAQTPVLFFFFLVN